MAMQALEEKIVARVEKSWAESRKDLEQKASATSWMLRNLVAEQKDLREKLDEISTEAFESRSDFVSQHQHVEQKASATSWMLRNLVAEQKDLREKLDELSDEAFESRSDLIARVDQISVPVESDLVAHIHKISADAFEARADLTAQLEDIKREAFEARVDFIESLEQLERKIGDSASMSTSSSFEIQTDDCNDAVEHLEKERLKINELVELLEDKAKTGTLIGGLKKTVASARKEKLRREEPDDGESAEVEKATLTAAELDLKGSSSKSAVKETTPLSWSSQDFVAVPFSSKRGIVGDSYSSAFDLVAPVGSTFSRKSLPSTLGFTMHRPRPIARMTSSQSLPFLEPLS